MGLVFGHFGKIGRINLQVNKAVIASAKEIGLLLFFAGAGVEGGGGLGAIIQAYGFSLLLIGFLLVALPLLAGFVMFRYVLKLPLLDGMGSMTASMTCTPSLAMLIQVAETDDVASAYATTYPIALVTLVLMVQFLVVL
jgi:putative transport protein